MKVITMKYPFEKVTFILISALPKEFCCWKEQLFNLYCISFVYVKCHYTSVVNISLFLNVQRCVRWKWEKCVGRKEVLVKRNDKVTYCLIIEQSRFMILMNVNDLVEMRYELKTKTHYNPVQLITCVNT